MYFEYLWICLHSLPIAKTCLAIIIFSMIILHNLLYNLAFKKQ